MAYATVRDMIERFGQTEMVRLTTPADQDMDGIVMPVAEAKLEDATAVIDSYVGRRYRVPMDVAPQAIVRACCILARHDLAEGENKAPTEQMVTARMEVLKWLRDVSLGTAVLELDEVAPGDESYAQSSTRQPVYGGSWRLALMPVEFSIRTPGPIALIGDAIAERLKLAFPPAKFDHQFVPAKLDGAAWAKLLRRTPFVGLGFVEIEPQQDSSAQFTGAVRWAVFLVTKNERGPYERFFGDRFAPGVLQMMQVAVAVLQGHALKAHGASLGTIYAVRGANSYAEDWKDDTLAMVQLGLSVTISFGVADAIEGDDVMPGTLSGTTAQWSFDGGGSYPLTDTTTGDA